MGPPLGGALFTLGRAAPFLFNGVASLAAALALLGLRGPLSGSRDTADGSPQVAGVLRGFRWIWSMPFVRATTLAAAASNVTWGALDIVILVRASEGGAGGTAIGVMIGMLGLGGLLGAPLAQPLRSRFPDPILIKAVFWYEALLLSLLLLTRNPVAMGVIVALAALGATTWNTVYLSARLSLVPDSVAGAATGAARLLTSSIFPFGVITAGAIMGASDSSLALAFLVSWQVGLSMWVSVSSRIGGAQPLRRSPSSAMLQS